MPSKQATIADDIVRIRQSTLIGLNRDARHLPLSARNIMAQQSGQYVSSFKGRGMEFDEARPYQPGDDIRAMDWRVTARTGKAHSKVFREERERPVLLCVDYRRSMFFGTQQHFKSVLAAKVAALLAWSCAHHGDRLGGLVFSEQDHIELRPRRGKSACLHFIQQLAQHPAWESSRPSNHETSAADALARLQRVSKPGSLIFIISDFRHTGERDWSHLSQLSRHSELVLVDIHDPLESYLPPAGLYRVTDGEQELQLNTYQASLRDQYHQRYLERQQQRQAQCRKLGIFYISISTDEDYLSVLQQSMGLASHRRGRRS